MGLLRNSFFKSISNRISFLSRLRYCLPELALSIVYKALVLPLSDCDIALGHTYKFIRLQKRSLKVITFGKRDKVDPIFEKL